MKGLGIIAHNTEAAAFRRPLGSESADDHMAAQFDSPCNIANVSRPLFRRCQEVKNRAIMPHMIGMSRKTRCRHVSPKPPDGCRSYGQTLLRHIKRGLRNIKDRNVAVSA